ncbi:MAG: CoA ester lyase [Pseudomonadota bacterium]
MKRKPDNPKQNSRPIRARRSVLYLPASNDRALDKSKTLACDSLIFDLEDAVGPNDKEMARNALTDWFAEGPGNGVEHVIRINALTSTWGPDDLEAAIKCRPDAVLLPKVNRIGDVLEASAILEEHNSDIRLWAMIETPRAIADVVAIAEAGSAPGGRLDCLVVGSNDLAKDTGIPLPEGRAFMQSWLMQIVLAARVAGLDALDGVYNDFRDADGFEAECQAARLMGFDGKTLIHPSQIEPANRAFGASDADIATARTIVDGFADPQNAEKGVIQINGKMVERLHLEQAKKLLARATGPVSDKTNEQSG